MTIPLANLLGIENSSSYTVTGITLFLKQNQARSKSLLLASSVPIYYKTRHKKMSDHPWVPLTESKPTAKHANNDDHVLYRMSDWSMSANWEHIPKEATHWQMIVDSPPGNAARWEEIDEAAFQRLLKREFPEPTVPNLLIESTLRKFWNHG